MTKEFQYRFIEIGINISKYEKYNPKNIDFLYNILNNDKNNEFSISNFAIF